MSYKLNPFTSNLDVVQTISYLGTLYVNVTGDTMTGTLEIDVPTLTTKALILKTTDNNATTNIFEIQDSTGTPFLNVTPPDGTNGGLSTNILVSTLDASLAGNILQTTSTGTNAIAEIDGGGAVAIHGSSGLLTKEIGMYGISYTAGGNVTNQYGTVGGVGALAGSITNAYNFANYPLFDYGGSITNQYGYYFDDLGIASGPLTRANIYGLYIANITHGTTLNYAIYTNTGLVHFGDSVDLSASKKITIGDASTNADMLVFNSQRAWKFTAGGTGATTSLDLTLTSNDKQFRILSSTGNINFIANTSDTASSNWIALSAYPKLSIGYATVASWAGIGLAKEINQTIGIERSTTAATIGANLTIAASSSTSGSTDKVGGTLALQTGLSTGGSAATLNLQVSGAETGAVGTVTLNTGGTGYTAGDVLTLVGGNSNCTVTVSTVSAGVITAISLTAAGTGYYIENAHPVTGGTGTGAKINVTALTGTSDNAIATAISITGRNRIGLLGTAIDNNFLLKLAKTLNIVSADKAGLYIDLQNSLPYTAGGLYGFIFAIKANNSTGTANWQNALKINFGVNGSFAGTLANAMGGWFPLDIAANAGGTITSAIACRTWITAAAGSTTNIADYRAFEVQGTTNAGSITITNFYGLFINDQTTPVPTQFVAILTAGGAVYLNNNKKSTGVFRVASVNNQNLICTDPSNDRVGIGTGSPAYRLHLSFGDKSLMYLENTTAGSSSQGAIIFLGSNGGAANASGDRLGLVAFNGMSDATTRSTGATIEAYTKELWSATALGAYIAFQTVTPTTTSRVERFRVDNLGITVADAHNLVFGTTTGTKIGTGTTQKIGFWNATPIVQPANTVAIDTLLVNLGLRASGAYANFATTIQPRAGTATANTAPLKFTSGTLLTSVEAGAMEFYDNSLWFTNLAVRRTVTQAQEVLVSDVTVGNTTTETQVYSIAHGANYLRVGKSEETKIIGTVTSVLGAGANTLTCRVKYAGTTVASFVMPELARTAVGFELHIMITVRAIGAGTTSIQIHANMDIEGTISDPIVNTLATGLDSTTAQATTVTLKWSDAAVGNTITLLQGYTMSIDDN